MTARKTECRRVMVGWGDNVIADQTARAPLTERFAAAMRSKFRSIRISTEAAVASMEVPSTERAEVPGDPRLWAMTVL